jgi:hypothetical protein
MTSQISAVPGLELRYFGQYWYKGLLAFSWPKYYACSCTMPSNELECPKPRDSSAAIYWSWSTSCGRQPVDQFVLVSGLSLGLMTRCYLSLLFSYENYFVVVPRVPSLTRGRVCSLQYNRWLVRLLKTNNHTLLSHLRLCSLFVASYGSQGLRWRYSNPLPHGEEWDVSTVSYIGIQFVPHRNHITSPLHSQPGHWGPITTHYRLIWDCVLVCLLLRLVGTAVEVFLPVSTRGSNLLDCTGR